MCVVNLPTIRYHPGKFQTFFAKYLTYVFFGTFLIGLPGMKTVLKIERYAQRLTQGYMGDGGSGRWAPTRGCFLIWGISATQVCDVEPLRVWFFHSILELHINFSRSTFVIIIDKTINKSPLRVSSSSQKLHGCQIFGQVKNSRGKGATRPHLTFRRVSPSHPPPYE